MEYNGFFLKEANGNNVFSYEKRTNKSIYVAPLKKVDFYKDNIIENVKISDKVAFSEYDEENEIEKNIFGIKNFIKSESDGKKIYIFDNHNHCFYFVASEVIENTKKINLTTNDVLSEYLNEKINTPKRKLMIHFDQHKDMRIPDTTLSKAIESINSHEYFFCEKVSSFRDKDYLGIYTNYNINVGNFIVPLIENKFIEDVIIVDSTYSMEELEKNMDMYDDIILDIDLDFFSSEMDYIDDDYKIDLIEKCYDKASLITICTSPYFIEFDRAKQYLSKILDRCIK